MKQSPEKPQQQTKPRRTQTEAVEQYIRLKRASAEAEEQRRRDHQRDDRSIRTLQGSKHVQ
jgi:hypothetical protein